MTLGGWTFMLVSIGCVVGLVAWCFRRVLAGDDGHPPAER